MSNFLMVSIVGSIVLTLALNLIPRLFPNASRKAGQKIMEAIEDDDRVRGEPGPSRPRVRVYFPWKAMLIVSIILTVLVNASGYIARLG